MEETKEKRLLAKLKEARRKREAEAKQTTIGGMHYLVRLIKFMDY